MTPLKAIRLKCLDCCCYQANEVRLCTATKCPLFAYRMGHNPALQGKRVKTHREEETQFNPTTISE